MPYFQLTKRLVVSINEILNREDLSQDEKEQFIIIQKEYSDLFQNINSLDNYLFYEDDTQSLPGIISLDNIKLLSTIRKKYKLDGNTIRELTLDSSIASNDKITSSYTPEFKRYLDYLRLKHSKEEHTQLLSTIDPARQKAKTSIKPMLEDLGLPLNIIAVMITLFLCFYYAGTQIWPNNKTAHVASGAVGLIFALILETAWFFIKHYYDTRSTKLTKDKELQKRIYFENNKIKPINNINKSNIIVDNAKNKNISSSTKLKQD